MLFRSQTKAMCLFISKTQAQKCDVTSIPHCLNTRVFCSLYMSSSHKLVSRLSHAHAGEGGVQILNSVILILLENRDIGKCVLRT